MFVLGDGLGKEISRRKALYCKKLVVADDIERGCEANIEIEEGDSSGVLSIKRDNTVVEGVETPLTFLVTEFGVFGRKSGLRSEIQVALCDGAMLVTLIKGAIAIRLDGNVLVASRGLSESEIPPCHLDTVQWESADAMTSLSTKMSRVAPLSERYPYDYIYSYEVSGENLCNDHQFAIRPIGDAIDISMDKLTAVELAIKERERIAQAKLATKAAAKAMSEVGTSSDDLDFGDMMYSSDSESDSDDADNIYMF